jgi:hypothetical protein
MEGLGVTLVMGHAPAQLKTGFFRFIWLCITSLAGLVEKGTIEGTDEYSDLRGKY